MSWDVVVIGSGVGGLVAATALARQKVRVLVLEQHYLPGGWTQSFALGGYRFSPGVHYIGNLGQGGDVRRFYEGLGVSGDIEFMEMNPDGFDHYLIDGERFDQPKGFDRWLDRLYQRFPLEREGIDRYFSVIHRVVRDVQVVDKHLSFPDCLTIPFRTPSLVRWGLSTAGKLLDSCIRDPLLKAILSAQCGNHGLAPSRVSLPVHALMTSHYLDGGYYPRGGAKRIAQAYIKELRRRGGSIRVSTRVKRILTEKRKTIGVELANGEQIFCDHVVCNADPAVVYGKLIEPERCKKQIEKVKRTEWSVSLVSVFLAVDMNLRKMGYDSGNYWWYRDVDVDGLYARIEREAPSAQVDGLFLSISSLKDPSHRVNGHHTVEMFTFLPYEEFVDVHGGEPGVRSPLYEQKKRRLSDALLVAAENVIPDLRHHIKFMAVGTPLTNEFYCASYRGASYGTAKTPSQLGPFSFDQRGPFERLHFCGASTLSHGVAGASMSGIIAAQHVMDASAVEDVIGPADGSLRVLSAEHPESWMHEMPRPKKKPASNVIIFPHAREPRGAPSRR